MKKLFIAGLSIGLLAGCASTDTKNEAKSVQKQEAKKNTEQKEQVVNEKDFVDYTKKIRGGNFIKEVKLDNNNADIIFYDSFTTYKAAHADSTTTEEQYKQYFSTGDTIEKIFVEESSRLLRRFHALNSVKMSLTFEGKNYSINLSRKDLNDYLGFKVESLNVANGSWKSKFVEPYVYNKTKRTEFFNKFVKVQ